jgi:high-affinity iron transporter
VGLGAPATSFPLAVLCGLGAGALVGFLIYKGGNKTSLQIFLVISTCFLYLVAAGLFSKGVWNLEQNAWVKLAGEGAAEAGAGPGSYDIRKSVWHVNVSLNLDRVQNRFANYCNSAVHRWRMAMAGTYMHSL